MTMRTIATREAIGFPRERGDWNRARATYDTHSLRIAGHPVMEDWEDAYMERLAQICAAPAGVVLELGYGMGLAARAIQSRGVARHYIVECHPEVAARCLVDLRNAFDDGRVHLITG